MNISLDLPLRAKPCNRISAENFKRIYLIIYRTLRCMRVASKHCIQIESEVNVLLYMHEFDCRWHGDVLCLQKASHAMSFLYFPAGCVSLCLVSTYPTCMCFSIIFSFAPNCAHIQPLHILSCDPNLCKSFHI